jgi:pyruvate dehydrogenase E1 component
MSIVPERLAATMRAAERDVDPGETQEWLEALAGTVRAAGDDRARFLLQRLREQAQALGLLDGRPPYVAYQNTIALERQGVYPGDLEIEERLTAIVRWNALAMVVRANKAYGELGGHVASYASAAEIFEVGFNHFFRAADATSQGDLVFFQPHSAPGVYARAFLEGRLGEEQLANFRRELSGNGLSSYPHPWLMPEFWQFPTGSMGLGPITSIYQARFSRYLEHRGLIAPSDRRVWGVFGDGEMDEPESIAALTLAAREKLDNLSWIVNCNLQRLDGPVRGNGQIIAELEALFTGAGWNVIKVLWGSEWDALFARDKNSALLRNFAATVDGRYQTLGANDGAYNQAHFFDLDPDLQALVASMSAADIDGLRRGGHDVRKLYAAMHAARRHKDRPTVILAKTKKGYGVAAAESKMTAHQQKKLDLGALRQMRDRFDLPLSDSDLEEMRFYRPAYDSKELEYLRERRAALGGALPLRRAKSASVAVPARGDVSDFAITAAGKTMSTTTAVVRIFNNFLRDKELGPRIVPIVADEARTFGMDNMFRQVGIYASTGQLYEPQDAGSMLFYREAKDGQLLEEGITEAGALSSWIAAATSYSVHDRPMLPFYIFYSMFGFQRVGDLIWAAADQRARISYRRHGRTHDARRRGLAASGRFEPRRRRNRSDLPGLRSGLRLRSRRHRRLRGAPDDDGWRGRLLLPHRDERELSAAVDARARFRRHHQRHAPYRVVGSQGHAEARAFARFGGDLARSHRCRESLARRLGCGRRSLERHEFQRTRARSASPRALEYASSAGDRAHQSRRDVSRGRRDNRGRDRLRPGVSQADRAVRKRRLRDARNRWVRPQRYARGAPPILRGRPARDRRRRVIPSRETRRSDGRRRAGRHHALRPRNGGRTVLGAMTADPSPARP